MTKRIRTGLVGLCVMVALTSVARPCVTFEPGKTEVVIAEDAEPVNKFAAEEAANYLSQVLSSPVLIVHAPTPGKASLILGTNAWTKAAGLSTDDFERDEFALVIDSSKKCIYAYGRDDPTKEPRGQNVYLLQFFERATLFAVYDFLEVACGVRFYFPGEIGTVVPKRTKITVPRGSRRVAPYFSCRSPYVGGTGKYVGEEEIADEKARAEYVRSYQKRLWLTQRCSTIRVPFCHGQLDFKIIERFGEEFPQYSQLQKNGFRNKDVHYADEWRNNQICHSSGAWDEIYQDCVSYLKGEDASVRGIISRWSTSAFGWNPAFAYRKYVDVMPQDGMQECFCEKCQKAYDHREPKGNYATELIWGNVAKLANRIREAGFPEARVCMMAYPPYRSVPKIDLPTNICVEVAETGPWSAFNPAAMERELAEIKAWSEKIGAKVWTWTYPHKYPAPHDPCVPCFAPRAWMKYFKTVGPYIEGSFTEGESDRMIYQYLNFYVFSRLCWNANADVEKILAEHHQLMFGAGAEAMTKFYDLLEEKWTKEIVGTILDTPLGPVAKKPSDYEMATRVYSPAVLQQLKGYLQEAATAAEGDAMSTKRIGFMYKEIYKPLAKRMTEYLDKINVEKALARRKANPPRNILEDRYWSAWPSASAFDKSSYVTGPNAIHAVCSKKDNANDPRRYICQTFKGDRRALVKPNTRYRISFFLRLKNVVPLTRDGGVYFEFAVGKGDGVFYPTGAKFAGDMDWSYHEYEITTPDEIREEPIMCLRIAYAFGEAWYDDVVIEEISDSGYAQ